MAVPARGVWAEVNRYHRIRDKMERDGALRSPWYFVRYIALHTAVIAYVYLWLLPLLRLTDVDHSAR